MKNLYSVDEFVKQAIQRGYAARSEKTLVIQWCKKHPKEQYADDDLIELYRYLEIPKIGASNPYTKWHSTWDGHRSTKRYKADTDNR